jgi:hypothetical protein
MAVKANTNETYNVTTIREDLQEALISISPTECPFMSAIGTKSADNTYFEWAEVDLADPDTANRVIEGESAPGTDAATNAVRLANYTQISDKIVTVSDTNNRVNGVANAQTTAKQIAYKLKELKRDMESMLCANVAAAAGSSGVARSTAGLGAFLKTNTDRGATATEPTLSGTTAGYPNAAAGDGTLRAITEALLKGVIADCWTAGADPSIVLCGAAVKQKISTTFTGISTAYRQDTAKKVTAAIDVYVSDFGELQIVPSRWVASRDVFVLDPSTMSVAYLQKTTQKPLARTGHAENRMISVEYGLQVDSEKANGILADVDASL